MSVGLERFRQRCIISLNVVFSSIGMDRPEMQEFFNSLLTYRYLLIQNDMKDQHVTCLRLDTNEVLIRTIESLLSFLYSFIVATVISPMWGPS